MKKNLFIVLFFLFSTAIFAQKVDFEKKTNQIMLDNVPVGKIFILSESDKIETYSVKDMTDKEVVLIKLHKLEVNGMLEGVAEYNFITSGKKAYTDATNRKKFSKEMVKNGVFDKKGFNPEGEKRMLTLFSEKPALLNNTPDTNISINIGQNNAYNFKMVERNRQDAIMVFGDVIKQSSQDLGNITSNSNATNGKIINIFSISNHLGTKIADATSDLNSNNIQITTFFDKNTTTISTETGDMNNKKAIAEYLVKNNIW